MVLKNGDELMPAHERKPARDAPRVPEAERIFSRTFLWRQGNRPYDLSLVWLHLQSRFKAPKRSGAEWCRCGPAVFEVERRGGGHTGHAARRGRSREPCVAHA